MLKWTCLFFFICGYLFTYSQPITKKERIQKQDSISKKSFFNYLGNGYIPTKYFNFDLRYLLKYNQYEGIRSGIGGETNSNFSKKYRINCYTVYGVIDDRFKYSIKGSFRVSKQTNTWISASYTDDLKETGSTKFLTDKRFFQFFEPRLLNIDLFHKHITKSISLDHEITSKLLTKTQLAVSKIDPTYAYSFVLNQDAIHTFNLSTTKIALQWTPFDSVETSKTNSKAIKNGFPKFTLQYTKSFENIFDGDLSFSKLDFRTLHRIEFQDNSFVELAFVSGLASGDTPLTNLYHAYPNNINKETILQRFSVAGLNSFETMFFNEFFSDKFVTLQLKYYVKPINLSERFKPQLVLITRYAIGNIKNPERHQDITFNSLKYGYTESGFEINKLLFGFGLSFTYRYGAYHLTEFQDNLAFKFTFNVTL